MELTDEQYLEQSGLSVLLRHLFIQTASAKPGDDSLDFAEQFFRRVQSCRHVLGADWQFITSCRQNRRAFVFCLGELFRSFSLEASMSASEFHHLAELACSDFPRHVVQDACSCLEASPPGSVPPKYRLADLRVSVYFNIIYDQWLKQAMWQEPVLNIFRVKTSLDDLRTHRNAFHAFEQPPLEGVDEVISALGLRPPPLLSSSSSSSSSSSGGANHPTAVCDVSFEQFRRALVCNKVLERDVLSTSPQALPLIIIDDGNAALARALPPPMSASSSSSSSSSAKADSVADKEALPPSAVAPSKRRGDDSGDEST